MAEAQADRVSPGQVGLLYLRSLRALRAEAKRRGCTPHSTCPCESLSRLPPPCELGVASLGCVRGSDHSARRETL